MLLRGTSTGRFLYFDLVRFCGAGHSCPNSTYRWLAFRGFGSRPQEQSPIIFGTPPIDTTVSSWLFWLSQPGILFLLLTAILIGGIAVAAKVKGAVGSCLGPKRLAEVSTMRLVRFVEVINTAGQIKPMAREISHPFKFGWRVGRLFRYRARGLDRIDFGFVQSGTLPRKFHGRFTTCIRAWQNKRASPIVSVLCSTQASVCCTRVVPIG
jgi:hypothetical protein